MDAVKQKVIHYKTKYEPYAPAIFFVVGFLFDVITLSRIDDHFSIIQQGLYLLLIGGILALRGIDYSGQFHPKGFIKKVWHYNNESLHFLLGSLLSTYTLFFFVSSSFFSSFVFMVFMFVLLLANELPMFQNQGPWLKFAIYSLCLISFFSYVVPIFLGFIGWIPLVLAILISWLIVFLIAKLLEKKKIPLRNTFRSILAPSYAVGGIFILLYFLKFLPPLPISMQYMGIYHNISKENDHYILSYDRPWWLFWEKGAQTFYSQQGDKIYCFVRIFSPTGFKDKVYYHWFKKSASGIWESQDRIANAIVGGRDQGFRGYSVKSNYSAGHWKVQVETEDGREIGRLYFKIYPTEVIEREFKIDKF